MSGSADISATGSVVSEQMVESVAALTALVKSAKEHSTPLIAGAPGRIPPAAQVKAPIYLNLSPLNQILEYEVADQVISVQTGIQVSVLNKQLAKNNQRLAVAVPENWTLADLFNSGHGGTLSHAFGGPRDLLLGCSVILASGEVINCGGKVVKNVSGYDLSRLFIGAQGWLCVPVSVSMRLQALSETSETLSWHFQTPRQALLAMHALVNTGLPFSRLELMSREQSDLELLAQSEGMQPVVDEMCRTAMRTISGAAAAQSLKAEQEERCWRDLLIQQSPPTHILQIACPFSAGAELIEQLAPYGSMQATPARGTFTLRLDQAEMVGTALSVLHELSLRCNLKLVAAIADDVYNYSVKSFPPDAAATQLKQRLKQRFDPGNIFNPFVML